MQGLKSNTGRFKSWDVDLEGATFVNRTLSPYWHAYAHLPFHTPGLFFSAAIYGMYTEDAEATSGQGVVLPRLYALGVRRDYSDHTRCFAKHRVDHHGVLSL